MLAIVRKDLKVVSQNKNVVMPIIIIIVVFFIGFPWLAGLAPTLIKGLGGQVTSLEGILTHMPAGMQQELAGFTISQKVIVFVLEYMLLPFFLIIPLMAASLVAADSFAGEKERKTLEALLYTPTTDRELLIAKMLSGWLASIAIALGGFLIYAINVNAAAWSQMQRIFFPNALWLVLVIWVVPALSGLGVSLMVVASARAQGFQDANQMAGLVVLPIVALFYAQLAGAIFLNISILLLMGFVIWLLAGLLIWLGSRSFRRNRLLAA
jgi:ABC-type transport system involved in multi-copper enzyme maturation permease subunit